MEIVRKTKFNLEDIVFFMWRNQICSAKVCSIRYSFRVACGHLPGANLQYRLYAPSNEEVPEDFREHQLFASKQELVDHLLKGE